MKWTERIVNALRPAAPDRPKAGRVIVPRADDSVREPIAASAAARAAGATWEAHVQALHRLYARVAAL